MARIPIFAKLCKFVQEFSIRSEEGISSLLILSLLIAKVDAEHRLCSKCSSLASLQGLIRRQVHRVAKLFLLLQHERLCCILQGGSASKLVVELILPDECLHVLHLPLILLELVLLLFLSLPQ